MDLATFISWSDRVESIPRPVFVTLRSVGGPQFLKGFEESLQKMMPLNLLPWGSLSRNEIW